MIILSIDLNDRDVILLKFDHFLTESNPKESHVKVDNNNIVID